MCSQLRVSFNENVIFSLVLVSYSYLSPSGFLNTYSGGVKSGKTCLFNAIYYLKRRV